MIGKCVHKQNTILEDINRCFEFGDQSQDMVKLILIEFLKKEYKYLYFHSDVDDKETSVLLMEKGRLRYINKDDEDESEMNYYDVILDIHHWWIDESSIHHTCTDCGWNSKGELEYLCDECLEKNINEIIQTKYIENGLLDEIIDKLYEASAKT